MEAMPPLLPHRDDWKAAEICIETCDFRCGCRHMASTRRVAELLALSGRYPLYLPLTCCSYTHTHTAVGIVCRARCQHVQSSVTAWEWKQYETILYQFHASRAAAALEACAVFCLLWLQLPIHWGHHFFTSRQQQWQFVDFSATSRTNCG